MVDGDSVIARVCGLPLVVGFEGLDVFSQVEEWVCG